MTLRLSFGQADITPSEPSYLAAHGARIAKHTGILDPISWFVLVLEQNGERFAFGSAELTYLDEDLVDRLREEATSHGIPAGNLVVGGSDNHAAPEFLDEGIFAHGGETGARPGYRDFLVRQFGAALEDADSFVDVEPGYGESSVEGFYGNRSDPHGPADKVARVLDFRSQDGTRRAAVVNLNMTPTVLGASNLLVSADLPGALRRNLSEAWGCPVVFTIGACGDVSPRQYRQGDDPPEMERIAKGISDQIVATETARLVQTRVSVHDVSYRMEYETDTERLGEAFERARQQLDTRRQQVASGELTGPNDLMMMQSGVAMLSKLMAAEPRVDRDVRAKVVCVGELRILALSAALFTEFGNQLLQATPGPAMIWGLMEGSVGYLIPEHLYGVTAESLTTSIPPGMAEEVVAHFRSALQRLSGSPDQPSRRSIE